MKYLNLFPKCSQQEGGVEYAFQLSQGFRCHFCLFNQNVYKEIVCTNEVEKSSSSMCFNPSTRFKVCRAYQKVTDPVF